MREKFITKSEVSWWDMKIVVPGSSETSLTFSVAGAVSLSEYKKWLRIQLWHKTMESARKSKDERHTNWQSHKNFCPVLERIFQPRAVHVLCCASKIQNVGGGDSLIKVQSKSKKGCRRSFTSMPPQYILCKAGFLKYARLTYPCQPHSSNWWKSLVIIPAYVPW